MTLTLILVAGAGFAVVALVRGRRPAEDQAYHYFRCSGCRQKLRYLAHKADRRGMCPRCLQHCKLSTAGEGVAVEQYSAEGYPVGASCGPWRADRLTASQRTGRSKCA
ncbi:MAG TPA: hypothetical protein VG013_38565 [Gemmataceae bacterium]|jgi:hypothetical protein|nr:hypothetical protein [Gemmataceae bacterium]